MCWNTHHICELSFIFNAAMDAGLSFPPPPPPPARWLPRVFGQVGTQGCWDKQRFALLYCLTIHCQGGGLHLGQPLAPSATASTRAPSRSSSTGRWRGCRARTCWSSRSTRWPSASARSWLPPATSRLASGAPRASPPRRAYVAPPRRALPSRGIVRGNSIVVKPSFLLQKPPTALRLLNTLWWAAYPEPAPPPRPALLPPTQGIFKAWHKGSEGSGHPHQPPPQFYGGLFGPTFFGSGSL